MLGGLHLHAQMWRGVRATPRLTDIAQDVYVYHRSLKAYLAPTGLVSEPRGDLTCRGVEEPWKLYVLYEPECVGG